MRAKSPFEDLKDEHVSLLGEMTELVGRMRDMANPEKTALGGSAGVLRDGLEMFDHHLHTHFRREEEGLFPEAQRMISGGAQGADVFGRFFAEEAEDDMGAHATLSERTSKLLSILADLEALGGVDEATSRKLLAIGNATAGLLQRHAAKEDSLIFPMIERSLTPGQVEQVSARLEKIGSARDLTGESPEEGLSQLGG